MTKAHNEITKTFTKFNMKSNIIKIKGNQILINKITPL